jgi:hypothetical protein
MRIATAFKKQPGEIGMGSLVMAHDPGFQVIEARENRDDQYNCEYQLFDADNREIKNRALKPRFLRFVRIEGTCHNFSS